MVRKHLSSRRPCRPAIVVEAETAADTVERLQRSATVVTAGHSSRACIAATMSETAAAFAGGASGRLWYKIAGVPLPDGLMTATLLLEILSKSDRRLSEVLADQDR